MYPFVLLSSCVRGFGHQCYLFPFPIPISSFRFQFPFSVSISCFSICPLDWVIDSATLIKTVVNKITFTFKGVKISGPKWPSSFFAEVWAKFALLSTLSLHF